MVGQKKILKLQEKFMIMSNSIYNWLTLKLKLLNCPRGQFCCGIFPVVRLQ